MNQSDTTKVIFFNGPPRSGKDFLMERTNIFLGDNGLSPISVAFSDAMYLAISKLYGIPQIQLERIKNSSAKDEPNELFFGKTLREVAISLSEEWFKPFHDDRTVFAKVLARELQYIPNVYGEHYILIDTGFFDECFAFCEQFGDALDSITLIRINRDGTSFDGDSRHYITNEMIEDYNSRESTKVKIVGIDYSNNKEWIRGDREGNLERFSEFNSIIGAHTRIVG